MPRCPKFGHMGGALAVKIDTFTGAEIVNGSLRCHYDATITNNNSKLPRFYTVVANGATCLPAKGFAGSSCTGPTCSANCIPK